MARPHPALLGGCEELIICYRLLSEDDKDAVLQLACKELQKQHRIEGPVILRILGEEYIPAHHYEEGAITAYDLLLEAQVYEILAHAYADERHPLVTYWRRIGT